MINFDRTDPDRKGSFINEPTVSESAVIEKVNQITDRLSLNKQTTLNLSVEIDNRKPPSLDLKRASKELEASLYHKPGNKISARYTYEPNWQTFDALEVVLSLKGTSAIFAELVYDPETQAYQSRLIDRHSTTEIAREPVSQATVESLLIGAGLNMSIGAKNHQDLDMTLYSSTKTRQSVQVKERHVLAEDHIMGDSEDSIDVVGSCEIEREKYINENDILTTTTLTFTISIGSTTHHRQITICDTINGTILSVEEIEIDEINDQSKHKSIELDYVTLERLLKQIDKVDLRIDQV